MSNMTVVSLSVWGWVKELQILIRPLIVHSSCVCLCENVNYAKYNYAYLKKWSIFVINITTADFKLAFNINTYYDAG